MCINWKVVGGLAVAGLVVWMVAPNLVASALPLLLVAACPLSMLFMGKSMMGGQDARQGQQASPPGVAGQYTCPMHPQVSAAGSGPCPKCGMALVPAAPPRQVPAPQLGGVVADVTREEELALLQVQLRSVSVQQAALARQIEQLREAETEGHARQIEQVRPAEGEARPSKARLYVDALRTLGQTDAKEPGPPSKALKEAEQVARDADGRR